MLLFCMPWGTKDHYQFVQIIVHASIFGPVMDATNWQIQFYCNIIHENDKECIMRMV
jgi:hypothetical protein